MFLIPNKTKQYNIQNCLKLLPLIKIPLKLSSDIKSGNAKGQNLYTVKEQRLMSHIIQKALFVNTILVNCLKKIQSSN